MLDLSSIVCHPNLQCLFFCCYLLLLENTSPCSVYQFCLALQTTAHLQIIYCGFLTQFNSVELPVLSYLGPVQPQFCHLTEFSWTKSAELGPAQPSPSMCFPLISWKVGNTDSTLTGIIWPWLQPTEPDCNQLHPPATNCSDRNQLHPTATNWTRIEPTAPDWNLLHQTSTD